MSSPGFHPCRFFKLAILALGISTSLATLRAVEPYETGRVAIGGGGFTTGIQFHPRVKDRLYARGDCTGFFRKDADPKNPSGGTWKQLCDTFGTNEKYMYGCLAMAFDPVSDDTIYAALGISIDPYGGASSPGVYKSTDAGNTWKRLLSVPVASNMGDARVFGHNLSVDPNNPKILYYGSQEYWNIWEGKNPVLHGGLQMSTDGGATWKVRSDIPIGPKLNLSPGNAWSTAPGIRTVLCDPRLGTIKVDGETRTKVVYLGIRSNKPDNKFEDPFTGGVYRSTDGGQTFTMLDGSPHFPANILMVGKKGNKLVMTTEREGIQIFENDKWTSALDDAGKPVNGLNGIDVDPTDETKLVGRGNETIWRSTDGGLHWKVGVRDTDDSFVKYSDNIWTYAPEGGGGDVAFDPSHTGSVVESDCFSIWKTDNVWDTKCVWHPLVYGLENTCSLWMTCAPAPSKNLLYYACQDVRGFQWENLATYPTRQSPVDPQNDGGTYDRCFAVCEKQPDHIFAVKVVPPKGLFTSSDDGQTWVQQPDPPDTSSNTGLTAAVSSSNPDHVVFIDSQKAPYYTTNAFSAGALKLEWTKSDIAYPAGYGPTVGGLYDSNKSGLVSDKVVDDKFYLSVEGPGKGMVFVSTDGGKSFAVPANQQIPWTGGGKLITSPGLANDLWLLKGGANIEHPAELYHSTDGAVTWSQLPASADMGKIFNFAVGKNAPDNTNPTLFYVGQYKDVWGVFRSTDMGKTFDIISNDKTSRGYSNCFCMEADRQVYGRVYLNTDGTGISYLQIAGSPIGSLTK